MKIKRTTLTALAAMSILALAGCTTADAAVDVPPLTDPAVGEVPEGVLDGVQMTYAADGGTTQEGMMAAWFDPFAEASGAVVNQDSPQTLAKVKSQVESGNIQWDLVSSFGPIVSRECGTLFAKLDTSKIDTSKLPEGIELTECGVPSVLYATGLVYNTDTFGESGPTTWAEFFDTESFPGTRAVYGGDGQIDAPTVQAAAIAAGWDPSTELTAEWAGRGIDALESIKDSLVFYNTGAAAQQMLESGEADVAAVWNGRALAAEKNGAPVQAEWNDWISVIDYFAIVKGTPRSEAAYYAINYALGADQQAGFTEATGYSPANVDAEPEIDELTRSYLTTTPERMAESVPLQLDFWSQTDIVAPLQDRWSALVAGA